MYGLPSKNFCKNVVRPLSIPSQQQAYQMGLLFPETHHLLVLQPTLVKQYVCEVGVGQVLVLLEALVDDGTDSRQGDIECMQGTNFRSLSLCGFWGQRKSE
jgi:hypothetical protein